MSKFKKRMIIVLLCTAVFAGGLFFVSKSGNNPVSNVVNTALSPVQTAAVSVTEPVKSFIDYLREMKNLKSENEALKSELETLKKESRNREEYKRENTRLKKILQLADDLDKCDTVAAKVVSYEPHNWFYSLMINKGERDGIKKDNVVITPSGLAGKVTEVGFNWSRVSTILDSANSVGIKLTRTGDVGIAQGDAELLKKKKFCISYISKETALINGDLIETSGLGGIYPPGLSVGTIEEIQVDSTGGLTKAIVSPAVDFDDIYEVLVVTYWEPAIFDVDKVRAEYDASRADQDTGMRQNSIGIVQQEPAENNNSDNDNASETGGMTEDNTDGQGADSQ